MEIDSGIVTKIAVYHFPKISVANHHNFAVTCTLSLLIYFFIFCSLHHVPLQPRPTLSHPNLSPRFPPVFTKISKRSWKISYLSLNVWTTSMPHCRRLVIRCTSRRWMLRKYSPMKTRYFYRQFLLSCFTVPSNNSKVGVMKASRKEVVLQEDLGFSIFFGHNFLICIYLIRQGPKLVYSEEY